MVVNKKLIYSGIAAVAVTGFFVGGLDTTIEYSYVKAAQLALDKCDFKETVKSATTAQAAMPLARKLVALLTDTEAEVLERIAIDSLSRTATVTSTSTITDVVSQPETYDFGDGNKEKNGYFSFDNPLGHSFKNLLF